MASPLHHKVEILISGKILIVLPARANSVAVQSRTAGPAFRGRRPVVTKRRVNPRYNIR